MSATLQDIESGCFILSVSAAAMSLVTDGPTPLNIAIIGGAALGVVAALVLERLL